LSSRFPFSEFLETEKGTRFHFQQVLEFIWPLLTAERRNRIEAVVQGRTFNCVSVLENIYDRGNASAVLRSQEALGFGAAHMIELGEKFKESQRTTAGADKWVEVKKWKSTESCVLALKDQGFQVVATHLDAKAKAISQIDFSKPTALVLGNEKEGISLEMQKLADHTVILPMTGFVQSYNISVAAALSFYHMHMDRNQRLQQSGDCTELEKQILKAVYALRTLDSSHEILVAKGSSTK
jgi:tRNA (guanosine-2'-O-)-methyltransferase